jgi:hypothetical protein
VDFLALYDRCVSSGLKACINMSNSVGLQEITLTCHFPTAIASAWRRRCRRRPRRCGQAASAAVPPLPRTSLPPILAALPLTRPKPPPPAPEPLPLESPPTKWTRKAAKRRCKVELLRDVGVDNFCFSPPLHTPPLARSPLPPSPTPTSSPTTEQSTTLSNSLQIPKTLTFSIPDYSAPAPAPSTIYLLQTSLGLHSSQPLTAPARSTPTSPVPATPEPPALPPWHEGYVFSTDPD